MNFGDGDVLVDITKTFDTKVAALRTHASQLSGWDPEPRLRTWAAALGDKVGRDLAEGFTVPQLRVLDDEGASEPARDA
ncbi:MAG: hypothetical protein KY460_17170 [Actinobacteria bacterium]|nr:hypothetical protein [Actinomycetota bacterium]